MESAKRAVGCVVPLLSDTGQTLSIPALPQSKIAYIYATGELLIRDTYSQGQDNGYYLAHREGGSTRHIP